MSEHFDPYVELDLPRDASDADVRAAFRNAAKKAHPDAGGTAEAFGRVARAEMILTDPAKRRKFDQTGHADEAEPDNSRVLALQQIELFIEEQVQKYINGNFVPSLDPRHRDLLQEFRDKTNHEISQISAALLMMEKAKVFLRDMGKKFTTKDKTNPIGRGFERRLRAMDGTLTEAKASIELRRLALQIADGYTFAWEPPPAYGTTTWVGVLTR